MPSLQALVVVFLLACARPSAAQEQLTPPPTKPPFPQETAEAPMQEQAPWLIRWMIQPINRGMTIRLPIIATDPNRGVTEGVMPIWVIQERNGTRIEAIHAPSLTYNPNFGLAPTYRCYYYPASDESMQTRMSINKYEKEGVFQYQDQSFMQTNADVFARFHYNVDASQRFYGIGPDSPQSAQSNFKEDYFSYRVRAGYPLFLGSHWRAHAGDYLRAEKVLNGPLRGIPGTDTEFPQVAAADHRQQVNETSVNLDYDSRDNQVTATRGFYTNFFAEHAFKGFASAYEYGRFGGDLRGFHPWGTKVPMVSAGQLQFQQVYGNAPFWAQSALGGKYSLRAYGEGRYVDRGVATLNFEQRLTVYQARMAGVTTEFELAPFVGAGQVFNRPSGLAARYLRPVVGSAVRAVARPQVVGSIDLGVGREGLVAFMDINHPF